MKRIETESNSLKSIQKRIRKPDYGYIALKYFLGIACLGLICLIIPLVGFLIDWSFTWLLLFICIPVAFLGLYIGTSYIPLYYYLLRPIQISNLWSQILDRENVKGNEVVLDVGCGTGGVTINVAKQVSNGKVIGIDIFKGVSGNSPDQAQANAKIEGVNNIVEFQYGNVLEIPHPNNTFDIVTAGSVLHEIKGDENKLKAVKEIIRVLKPGGTFITVELLRDRKMFLFLLIFGLIWKPKEYWNSLLKESGFEKCESEYYTQFLNIGVFIGKKNTLI